jgi:polo-like kinase 4
LHSYFEDSTRVFIVTELCPNGNLFQYVLGHPEGLPENQVRGVMRDIVEGIQGIVTSNHLMTELHSHGIMHRDLKLSNILLDKDMYTVFPYSFSTDGEKIADFGLARIIDDSKSEEAFTFCGTPNYISPEILAREPYGLPSDIWSLGCILLTLLSGTPPFGVIPERGEYLTTGCGN